MNLDDLAALMGKTREEVKGMLDRSEVIELKLTERKGKETTDEGNLKLI